MSLCELIFDVKLYIALFSEKVWLDMVIYDKQFHDYAYTKEGICTFIDNFKLIEHNTTRLLGYIHSINYLPAIINTGGNKYWYYKHVTSS